MLVGGWWDRYLGSLLYIQYNLVFGSGSVVMISAKELTRSTKRNSLAFRMFIGSSILLLSVSSAFALPPLDNTRQPEAPQGTGLYDAKGLLVGRVILSGGLPIVQRLIGQKWISFGAGISGLYDANGGATFYYETSDCTGIAYLPLDTWGDIDGTATSVGPGGYPIYITSATLYYPGAPKLTKLNSLFKINSFNPFTTTGGCNVVPAKIATWAGQVTTVTLPSFTAPFAIK